MKKFFVFVILFLFFVIFNIFSQSVKKNNEIGCVAGKISVQINKRYYGIKPGVYNDEIKMRLTKSDNTNDFFVTTAKKGYYFFTDIPTGSYNLTSFDLRQQVIEDVVSVSSKITGYPVAVYANKVIVLQNISVKFRVSDKMFVIKDDFDFIFDPADINEVKTFFEKKYKKTNKWIDYIWELNSNDKQNEYAQDANEVKIKALLLKADSDLATMDSQFAKGEYLMSMHYTYRILETLIKAYYVKRIDNNPPVLKDLIELAKLAKLELANDFKMLLIDITEFDKRSELQDNEEEFSKLFTREYTNAYVIKLNDFSKYMKSKLK